jgi:hypothetical protein
MSSLFVCTQQGVRLSAFAMACMLICIAGPTLTAQQAAQEKKEPTATETGNASADDEQPASTEDSPQQQTAEAAKDETDDEQATDTKTAKADDPTDPAAEVTQATDVEKKDGADKDGADKEQPTDLSKIDKQFQDLRRISEKGEVWFSLKDKVVVAGGQVCLNEGPLEMFACTRGTKEHESIIVISGRAKELHAGLLAIGAHPGHPVSFDPDYKKATGDEIEIEVHWLDKNGEPTKSPAQEWIKNVSTGKNMEHSWVFAGSGFFREKETGINHYLAEGGEVICVSNFTTAMLDLPVPSSQLDSGLLFEANTAIIPKLKTPVRLVLRVKQSKSGESSDADK